MPLILHHLKTGASGGMRRSESGKKSALSVKNAGLTGVQADTGKSGVRAGIVLTLNLCKEGDDVC